MTYDNEHLFICLLAISTSCLMRYPFSSFAHFLIVFLLLYYKNLNILDTGKSFTRCVLQIFFFTAILTVIEEKFLILMMSSLSFFFSPMDHTFGVVSKT